MKNAQIGFVGLGIMGKPMALRLHNAGYRLHVYAGNAAAGELVAAGAQAHDTLAQLAQHGDVIFTMVSDTAALQDVVKQCLPHFRRNQILIDMSTVSPMATRELAATLSTHDVHMVDAPVSGGEQGAINGSLSIMAGGDEQVIERLRPLLSVLGQSIVRIGDHGAGQLAKACNQLVVAQTLTAIAEAFTLAKAFGADPSHVRAALLGGFAASRVLDVHGQRMLDKNYRPGFKARLHKKDLHIVMDTARELGIALPGTSYATQLMNAAAAHNPELDSSCVAQIIERLNGMTDASNDA